LEVWQKYHEQASRVHALFTDVLPARTLSHEQYTLKRKFPPPRQGKSRGNIKVFRTTPTWLQKRAAEHGYGLQPARPETPRLVEAASDQEKVPPED
jgi:hypothetical protein